MKRRFLLMMAAVMAFAVAVRAQVTTSPSPLQENSKDVTIYFHADEGNKGMMGLPQNTDVYAHTGVEVVNADGTLESWKYAPEWLQNDAKYKLEYVSENLWKLYIGDIRTYYGVAANETVKRLCFVFRNAGGSKEGKGVGNTDIFVDVLETGFQLAISSDLGGNMLTAPKNVTFTAGTTENATISLYVNDTKIGEKSNTTSLQASYNFTGVGNYTVKAVANNGTETLEDEMMVVYMGSSQPSADKTIPPMGVTKNADGSYTFCLAAPQKGSVMLVGSWNGYKPNNDNLMKYIDTQIQGATFRYFVLTLPASTTGTEFGYYYYVDGQYPVGDPYARLVLDPYNDKYITDAVYPNMPAYPQYLVPNNTLVAYYGDDLLTYNWNVTDFKAPEKTNLVIYELLFRDFTGTEGKAYGDGTVKLAIEKLPYLKSLGVNAIELLPINEFDGNLSWGYNPNFYFATDKAYGSPKDYKEFIDKCHELGMAVILDVVFNQSSGLHPWYQMYGNANNSPFYNGTAPHAYSVLNDWNQGYPLVEQQWYDMVKFWLKEYKVDGFRFDLVKGLGDNTSYPNSGDSGTNQYNQSRIDRMKRIHDAMREVNPDAYFINENLAGAQEENAMAADGELNWANINDPGCQFAMGYESNASLNRMWAVKDGRTAGSTVAYLESHDEQRLAYKQIMWGNGIVKTNHAVAMQRLGSAAAQMILVPGSHMIWQFSEMGNAQNTKNDNNGNNVDNKIVNWNLLQDRDNYELMRSYSMLINIRLNNTDLFTDKGNYNLNLSTWSQPRYITTSNGNKELMVLINPSISGKMTGNFSFQSPNNEDYTIYSQSYGSSPTFDAKNGQITVDAGCYVVIGRNLTIGVDDIAADAETDTHIFALPGAIRVTGNEGPVAVYTLDGAKVAAAHGDASIEVAPGLYVVRAGGQTAKVIVR